MGAVIFSLDKAENPELCRSIMRNFLTHDRLKQQDPYYGLFSAWGALATD